MKWLLFWSENKDMKEEMILAVEYTTKAVAFGHRKGQGSIPGQAWIFSVFFFYRLGCLLNCEDHFLFHLLLLLRSLKLSSLLLGEFKSASFSCRGLDMSRFTLGKDDNEDKEGSLYDLFAVANHSGTVNFGHYTAFGRLAEADHPIDGLKTEGLGMSGFNLNVSYTSRTVNQSNPPPD